MFLIGHDEHDEVVGTRGEAPGSVVVVARSRRRRLRPADPAKVAYVMQTTLAADEAEQTAAVLRERFPAIAAPPRDDICYATTNRQTAIREIAQRCELVLVLGSQNSSNSLRLAEVAEKSGPPAYLVDDPSDVDLRWLAGVRQIGITAERPLPRTWSTSSSTVYPVWGRSPYGKSMSLGKTSISRCPLMWAEMVNPPRIVDPQVGIDEYISMAARKDRSTNSCAPCAQADTTVATTRGSFRIRRGKLRGGHDMQPITARY